MNKSKVILATVAFVVTAAGALAFKSAKHRLFAKTTLGGCKISNCFTTTNLQSGTVCKTANNTSYTSLYTTAACGASHAWTISHAQTAN